MARQQLAEAVGTAQPPNLTAAALRWRGEVLSRDRVTHFLSSSPYPEASHSSRRAPWLTLGGVPMAWGAYLRLGGGMA